MKLSNDYCYQPFAREWMARCSQMPIRGICGTLTISFLSIRPPIQLEACLSSHSARSARALLAGAGTSGWSVAAIADAHGESSDSRPARKSGSRERYRYARTEAHLLGRVRPAAAREASQRPIHNSIPQAVRRDAHGMSGAIGWG